MTEFKRISSIQELKDLFLGKTECCECFIQLTIGRSWKTIGFDGEDPWYVLNQIDESEEELTTEELTQSLIGEAIEKGQFYFAWF